MRTVAVAGLETACGARPGDPGITRRRPRCSPASWPATPFGGGRRSMGRPLEWGRVGTRAAETCQMEAVPARGRPAQADLRRATARDRTRSANPKVAGRSLHGPWPRCRIARAFSAIHWYATRLVWGEGVGKLPGEQRVQAIVTALAIVLVAARGRVAPAGRGGRQPWAASSPTRRRRRTPSARSPWLACRSW